MSDQQFTLSGPIYVAAQREAVESLNGENVVTDAFFMAMQKIDGEQALLLFTTKPAAERFIATNPSLAAVPATFRNIRDLQARVNELANAGMGIVIFDRHPGVSHGRYATVEGLASVLRELVAERPG